MRSPAPVIVEGLDRPLGGAAGLIVISVKALHAGRESEQNPSGIEGHRH